MAVAAARDFWQRGWVASWLLVLAAPGCMRCVKPSEYAGPVPWQSSVRADDWPARTGELRALHPQAEARALFAQRRILFAGIDGVASGWTKGVERTDSEKCRYPVISIQGTSDFIEGDEHGVFNGAAQRFAELFNREMLGLVRNQ